jgi:uncharacterized membrane protein YbhN (UPF0104 family)
MFYALISTVFLLAFSWQWWQTLLAVLLAAATSLVVIYLYRKKNKLKVNNIIKNPIGFIYLFIATIFQMVIQVTIYAVELHKVNPNIALHQVITYTGAANFSLFVALTPGAIGIRESFLLLTQRLHGISSANVIAANVLDRAVFLIFLVVLFVFTIMFHVKYRTIIHQADKAEQELKL